MEEATSHPGSVAGAVRRVVLVLHFTVLQAYFGRLFLTLGGALVTLVLVAEFFAAAQVTESETAAAALFAALVRPLCVFLLVVHMALAGNRGNGGDETVASLDLGAVSLLLGQWLGFAAIGAVMALGSGMVMTWYGGALSGLVWTLAASAELALVAAVALFARQGLRQPVSVVLTMVGFYLLTRLFPLLMEIVRRGVGEQTAVRDLATYALDMLDLVLPRLDGLAEATWILGGDLPPLDDYLLALAGALTYAGFALCLALVDQRLARR